MTITFKSETINDIVIEISQDKFEKCFKVGAYKLYSDGLARTINERKYNTTKQAQARYNYLKRKAKKGEL